MEKLNEIVSALCAESDENRDLWEGRFPKTTLLVTSPNHPVARLLDLLAHFVLAVLGDMKVNDMAWWTFRLWGMSPMRTVVFPNSAEVSPDEFRVLTWFLFTRNAWPESPMERPGALTYTLDEMQAALKVNEHDRGRLEYEAMSIITPFNGYYETLDRDEEYMDFHYYEDILNILRERLKHGS